MKLPILFLIVISLSTVAQAQSKSDMDRDIYCRASNAFGVSISREEPQQSCARILAKIGKGTLRNDVVKSLQVIQGRCNYTQVDRGSIEDDGRLLIGFKVFGEKENNVVRILDFTFSFSAQDRLETVGMALAILPLGELSKS